MNHLPRVIGPAPSEQAPLEFRERLSRERDRVRKEIELFQTRAAPKRAKAAKAERKKLSAFLKEKGITPEQLREMIQASSKKGSVSLWVGVFLVGIATFVVLFLTYLK